MKMAHAQPVIAKAKPNAAIAPKNASPLRNALPRIAALSGRNQCAAPAHHPKMLLPPASINI